MLTLVHWDLLLRSLSTAPFRTSIPGIGIGNIWELCNKMRKMLMQFALHTNLSTATKPIGVLLIAHTEPRWMWRIAFFSQHQIAVLLLDISTLQREVDNPIQSTSMSTLIYVRLQWNSLLRMSYLVSVCVCVCHWNSSYTQNMKVEVDMEVESMEFNEKPLSSIGFFPLQYNISPPMHQSTCQHLSLMWYSS